MCYYYCQHGNNGICDGGKGDGEVVLLAVLVMA
jgi:hypothetical protein